MSEKEIYIEILRCAPILAIMVAFYNNQQNLKVSIKKDRYEKVILPIYLILEPYFYNHEKLPYDAMIKINNIIRNNRHLTEFTLLYLIEKYEKSFNSSHKEMKKSYNNLCSYIGNAVDFLSIDLGLSKRTHKYKQLHNQFQNKCSLVCANIIFFIRKLFSNIIMVILVLLCFIISYLVLKRN